MYRRVFAAMKLVKTHTKSKIGDASCKVTW